MSKRNISKPTFDISPILRDLVKKFHSSNKNIFKDVLLVGMQHILGTTVDMLSVMKEFGLEDAIIGGKTYSTNFESARRIKKLGFTYILDGYQLGHGHFDDCIHEVIYAIWFKALEKIKEKKFKLVIILDDGADLLRVTPGAFFNGISLLGKVNKPNSIVGIEQTRGGTNHPLFLGVPRVNFS